METYKINVTMYLKAIPEECLNCNKKAGISGCVSKSSTNAEG